MTVKLRNPSAVRELPHNAEWKDALYVYQGDRRHG
jgi:hypothetical protein